MRASTAFRRWRCVPAGPVLDGVAMRDPYVADAGKINLWHTDYFHPSKYGSYLSALVHFATITGLDPMTLGPSEQAAAGLAFLRDRGAAATCPRAHRHARCDAAHDERRVSTAATATAGTRRP